MHNLVLENNESIAQMCERSQRVGRADRLKTNALLRILDWRQEMTCDLNTFSSFYFIIIIITIY